MLCFTIDAARCIQCGECAADCPVSIIDLDQGLPRILEHKETHCLHCQHCLAVCPTAALSILGIDPDTLPGLTPLVPDAVDNLLRGRRSVRRYRPGAVAQDVMQRLLDVAAHAPTGKNVRQLRLSVVDDPVVMQTIREQTMAGIRQAVLNNSLPVGLEFYAKFAALYAEGQDIIYRGAPHMLIASAPGTCATPGADPYIALSYFEIMAQALGLGTLWCGFAAWAITTVVPGLRGMLGIPREHESLYVMLFGYPAVRYARVVKRSTACVHSVRLERQG